MAKTSKNIPRDTFLYLLAIITLVVVAVGFGMAVFNYVDFYFPDPATDYYRSTSSYEGAIRQAMAMLIVVFPVFYWVSRFLKRDVDDHPEKRELKIRKWFLYLTLFAAALVIIGDLVAVINNFLKGELTTRFVLKALTMFFISGSVFYYYLAQLKESARYSFLKYLTPFIVAVIIAAVGWGFAVIGSPFQQRDKRFDERRISDLQSIQNYITNYWQNKEKLPVNLSDLEDPLLGIVIPVDPEMGRLYEYRVIGDLTSELFIGDLTFELCATFKTKDEGDQRAISVPAIYSPRSQNYSWQHGIGRTCFERTIDPDFFRIEKSKFL